MKGTMMFLQRDPMRASSLAMVAVATTILFAPNLAQTSAQVSQTSPIPTPSESMEGTSNWEIDNEHTSLVCAVSHFGLSFIYGRFNGCSGSVEMNFQEPDKSKFRFVVDASSIDTNNAWRDIQLRGDKCLDAKQYDSIEFESINVETNDKKVAGKTKRTFWVTGNLRLHGETRKLTIPIELLAMGNGADQKLRCGFMSRFVVSRSEFGLDAMSDSVGDSVAVTFCFQATQKESQPKEAPKAMPVELNPNSDGGLNTKAAPEKVEKLFSPRSDVAPVESPFGESGNKSSTEVD